MYETTWWQDFLRSLAIAFLAIVAYEMGNIIGAYISHQPLLLERTQLVFGLTGFGILRSSGLWLGIFFAGMVLYTCNRFFTSEFWLGG